MAAARVAAAAAAAAAAAEWLAGNSESGGMSTGVGTGGYCTRIDQRRQCKALLCFQDPIHLGSKEHCWQQQQQLSSKQALLLSKAELSE